jgi:hypothetical protein
MVFRTIREAISMGMNKLQLEASYNLVVSNAFNPSSTTHEIGHAFCGLHDEYVKPIFSELWEKKDIDSMIQRAQANIFLEKLGLTNCATYKTYFKKLIGKEIAFEGCTTPSALRSTEKSIMRNGLEEPRFNLVSCMFCLKEIDKKPVEKTMRDCLNMNVIRS